MPVSQYTASVHKRNQANYESYRAELQDCVAVCENSKDDAEGLTNGANKADENEIDTNVFCICTGPALFFASSKANQRKQYNNKTTAMFHKITVTYFLRAFSIIGANNLTVTFADRLSGWRRQLANCIKVSTAHFTHRLKALEQMNREKCRRTCESIVLW